MEKIQQDKQKQTPKTVWDCGSSLYDSFELKSFERQLDSAISSRTLSMPHLPPPPTPSPQHKPISKKPSKFSRSFHKLLKSVFGPKQKYATGSLFNTSTSKFNFKGSQDISFYVICGSNSAGSLYTIPEAAAEYGGVSPEFDKSSSLVKRAASERFSAASVGISCA